MLLEMKGITKKYPGVLALDRVDFELDAGEVMALIGQNGAGKTTLVKILAGAVKLSEGEVFLRGKKVFIKSPEDAYNMGFSFIYQEGGLINGLSGMENIFIGRTYPKIQGIMINWNALIKKGEELKKRFGIDVELKRLIEHLSPLERKKIEILKALSREPKILVLDEPTASLTKKETDQLFNIIKSLKKHGIGIIYISHFLDEVFSVADRITVLRDGRKVAVLSIKEATKDKLIRYELGEEIKTIENIKTKSIQEEKALEVSNLSTLSGLKDISFELYKGEILGIFGLGGQGKTRLAMALMGNDTLLKGSIKIYGKEVKLSSPMDALKRGITLVPQDRTKHGIILELSIAQNLTLPILSKLVYKNLPLILDLKKEKGLTYKIIKELNIKAKNHKILTKNLSGGNKQKVVIGKGILKKAHIFIFDEPTQGLDIKAREEVYKYLIKLSDKGISQIVISSDMDELSKITHRIMVMKDGTVKGIFPTRDITSHDILSIAYGGNDAYI